MSEKAKKIIAMDSETSGLTPADQVLSLTIKVIDVESTEVVDSMRVKVQYRGDVLARPDAMRANHLDPMAAKGDIEYIAANKISNFIEKHGGSASPLMGHNVGFDANNVRSMLTRNGYSANVLSWDLIDIQQVVARRIVLNEYPHKDKLELKKKMDGSMAPSLSQISVARANGIEIDENRAHDDDYDTDIVIANWKALGCPSESVRDLEVINDPYKAKETYPGKIISAKRWDGKMGVVREKKYYVTDKGIESVNDQYGEHKYHGLVLVDLTKEDVLMETLDRMAKTEAAKAKGETLKKGGLGATALKDVTAEISYHSEFLYDVKVEENSDPAQLDQLQKLASYCYQHVKEQRSADEETKYNEIFSQIVNPEKFSLNNPDGKIKVAGNDEKLVPKVAFAIKDMSEKERYAYISKLANNQAVPRGYIWAHSLLLMAERFGYRNGIKGFEAARVRELSKLIPASYPVSVVRKDLTHEAVNGAMKKALEQ